MINQYGNDINWVPDLENKEGPVYKRIAEIIEEDIQSGKLMYGAKLPPQRVIADHLGVNHGTVTRAYKLCEEKGLLKGTVGKGTFVSGSAGLPVELLTDHDDSDIISLGMTLPLYELNDQLKQYLNEMSVAIDYNIALKYCPPEGHIKHRYIAANWLRSTGIEADPDNMIISSGTQNALAVILTTIFEKGDRIAVDTFTYTGLKSLAKYLGIILVPVSGKGFFMSPEALSLACRREKIRGVYLMPDCHNPTASVMDDGDRQLLAEVIEEEDLLCIEDATYRFTLTKQRKAISSYIPDRSFYIHGTSKAVSPTFRISYLVGPKAYVNRLKQGINNLTWMASPFTAEILSLLQSTGQYKAFVAMKSAELAARNKLFDKIFMSNHWIKGENTMFRCLLLDETVDERAIEQEALRRGVQVFGISRFAAGAATTVKGIRLSISSPKSRKELVKGFIIIRDMLDTLEDVYEPLI